MSILQNSINSQESFIPGVPAFDEHESANEKADASMPDLNDLFAGMPAEKPVESTDLSSLFSLQPSPTPEKEENPKVQEQKEEAHVEEEIGKKETVKIAALVVPQENIAETESKSSVKQEAVTEDEPEPHEEKTESEAVSKRTGKRGRRKKNEKVQEGEPEEQEVYTMPVNPNLSISKIVDEIGLAPDNDFLEAKRDIEEKMNAIQVHKDLDLPNINLLYQQIDELNNIIHSSLELAKSQYESFCDKDNGFLRKNAELNSVGANDVERKRNAVIALSNYKMRDGSKVNLFQVAWGLRYACNFFSGVLEQLEMKRRCVRGIQDSILACK